MTAGRPIDIIASSQRNMSPSFTFASTLKTKAKFKMLVPIYQALCHHNQGDYNVKPSGLIAQIRECVSIVQGV